MTNIVYTHTDKMRGGIKDMQSMHMPTDRKVTIFQQPNKVAVVGALLVVGKPTHKEEHKDKRWYKWRSTETYGLRRNAHGTIIPWSATRPYTFKVGDQWKHAGGCRRVFDALDPESEHEGSVAFRKAVWETFGVKSMYDIFPIAEHYGLHRYDTMPYALRNAMRQPTMTEFTTQLFGKTRTSDSLMDAVSGTDPFVVALAHQFRGLVPDSALVWMMRNNSFDDEMEESFEPFSPWVRPVLKVISQRSRNNLVRERLDVSTLMRIHRVMAYTRNDYATKQFDPEETYNSWEDLQNPGRKKLQRVAAQTAQVGNAYTQAASAAQQATKAVSQFGQVVTTSPQVLTPVW